MALYVETAVAAIIFALILGTALFQLKASHVNGEPWRVRLGAAMTGAIVGGLVGFAIVPMRFALMESGSAGDPRLGLTAGAAFLVLIFFRRGVAARLPLIGGPVRAYRKASLRHTIELSKLRLERLARLDGKGGADDGPPPNDERSPPSVSQAPPS